jgi:DNA-binding transcriptional MerR regulator/DNA gyrase inhibitor GyrI
MFSIGEFSRVTGLTIKTLRFYHDEQLLIPASIDPQTGYRQYDPRQVETARVISFLRDLDLPLRDIKEILRVQGDEQVLDVLERQRAALRERIRDMNKAVRSLDQFILEERQAMTMSQSTFDVQEKTLEPMLIAGVRMKGHYSECGRGFATIGRKLGRSICGKPLMLHYEDEYKEDDADFEACMPVRQQRSDVDGVSCRELPGGRCVSLVHKGPYDQLGRSYEKILGYAKAHGYQIVSPTREVYLKGPRMIFKGNPKNYLTEIEMLIEPAASN